MTSSSNSSSHSHDIQALLAQAEYSQTHPSPNSDQSVASALDTEILFSTSFEENSDAVASASADRNLENSVEIKTSADTDVRDDFGRKRKRVERACLSCRKRRTKCDGGEPQCQACTNVQSECIYPPPTQKLTIKNFEALQRRIDELESKLLQVTQHTTPSQTSSSAPDLVHQTPSTQFQNFSTISHNNVPFSPSSDAAFETFVPESPISTSTYLTSSGLLPVSSPSAPIFPELTFMRLDDPSSISQPYPFPAELMIDEVLEEVNSSESLRQHQSSQSSESIQAVDEREIREGSLEEPRSAQSEDMYEFGDLFSMEERRSQEGEFINSSGIRRAPSWMRSISGNVDNDIVDLDLYFLPSSHEIAAMLRIYHEKLYYAFPVLGFESTYQSFLESSIRTSRQEHDTKGDLHLALLNRIFSIVMAYRGRDDDTEQSEVFSTRSLRLVEKINIFSVISIEVVQHLLLSCYYFIEICPSSSKIDIAKEFAILASFLVHSLQIDLSSAGDSSRSDRKIQYDLARAAHMCTAVEMASMLDEPDLIKGYNSTSAFEPHVSSSYSTSTWTHAEPVEPVEPFVLNEQHMFSSENTKICDLKRRIISKLYISPERLHRSDMEIDVVSFEEELLIWWTRLPPFLKNLKVDVPFSAPLDRLSALQSGLLHCKYIETSIMFYRPCLVAHLIERDALPIATGNVFSKFTTYCAEAALNLINTVLKTCDTVLQGFWWYLMGYVYSSSLILLAFQTTPVNLYDPQFENLQARSIETVQCAVGFFQEIVQHSPSILPNSVTHSVPSGDVRSMGKRCIGVLDKLMRVYKPRMEGQVSSRELPIELKDMEASFKDDCYVSDWFQKISSDRKNHEFARRFHEKFIAKYEHRPGSRPAPLEWRLLLGSGFFSTFKPPAS